MSASAKGLPWPGSGALTRDAKRPSPPQAVTELRARIALGISKAKVAREFGISRQTLYQYLQGSEAVL